MININTLRYLNEMHIGADVNKLESYILDYKFASMMCNMEYYKHNFLKLYKILKEMKPESIVFSDRTSLEEIKMDVYDKYLQEYTSYKTNYKLGVDDSTVDINLGTSSDLVGIANITGINISISYLNGHIYKIYAIGNHKKYMDITKLLYDKVPDHIKQIERTNIVELRGKVTIFNNYKETQDVSLNIPCSVINCLRIKANIDKLNIVVTDLFMDNSEEFFNNQWDKIEFIRKLGFNVPHHCLIRDIDKDIFSQALIEMHEYFDNIKNTDGINYEYFGIEVRLNKEIYTTNDNSLVYVGDKYYGDKVFTSVVKSIIVKNDINIMNVTLNIVPVNCNDKVIVKNIDIDDILKLDKYNIHVGCKVNFKVTENKAELHK